MKKRDSIKDLYHERALFRRRVRVGFTLVLLGLGTLVTRYVYLQVVRYDVFFTRSANNRIKPRILPPLRGLIYDRNGVLLADNVSAYRLEVIPEQVRDMKRMLSRLRMIVPLDDDDIEHFLSQVKQNGRFDNVPLKLQLTEDEIDRFAVNRWRFPGVDVVPYPERHYRFGATFAHVLGYVGRINANDLRKLDKVRYRGTTYVGRTGIERSYEKQLHGTQGYELDEIDVDGRVQRRLEVHSPIPGKNLYLSIDARIQKAAEDAFHGRSGAAVAIDPRNGQVLAMVSLPSFPPNLFVRGISAGDYRVLLNNSHKPLFNRAISGLYPPGSTVKPLLALGGLEMKLRRPQDKVLSTGVFHIHGQKRGYRDDRRGGFGKVDMLQAIMLSVNTYFYKLALDMGIDRLSRWMGKFGFGKATGIDLNNEVAGILPSRAWKARHFRQPWYVGETVIAGIGQGYWEVTPLQLAHALATFANYGVLHIPHLVMAEQQPGSQPVPLPQSKRTVDSSLNIKRANWELVDKGMRMVINNPRGTGYGLGKGFPCVIAGKSGTAERYSRTTVSYDNNRKRAYLAKRHRAWFEMFTPAEHPRIVVVVLLDSGAWGAADAGPIARKILDAWLRTQKYKPGARPTLCVKAEASQSVAGRTVR